MQTAGINEVTSNQPDVSTEDLKKLYYKRLLASRESFDIGDIGKDVSEAKGVGNKILTGLGDALKYLHTGEGNRFMTAFTKNDYTGAELAGMGNAKSAQEQASKLAGQQMEVEKTKSIGDYLAQQAQQEQQNKILAATLGKATQEGEQFNKTLEQRQIEAKSEKERQDNAAKLAQAEADRKAASDAAELDIKRQNQVLDEQKAEQEAQKIADAERGIFGKLFGIKGKVMPTVTSQSMYDRLPSGAKYVGPDGKQRTKP